MYGASANNVTAGPGRRRNRNWNTLRRSPISTRVRTPERGPGVLDRVAATLRWGPERTRAMLAEADRPQQKLACFHVAGRHRQRHSLYLPGRRPGPAGACRRPVHPNPTLHSYRERIQLGLEPIPADEFAAGFTRALAYERASPPARP